MEIKNDCEKFKEFYAQFDVEVCNETEWDSRDGSELKYEMIINAKKGAGLLWVYFDINKKFISQDGGYY